MPEPIEPPLRVELVPVGFYVDRIIEPVCLHRADRLYLAVARIDGKNLAAPFLTRVRRELASRMPALQVREVSVYAWDMESLVETFSAIIRKERSVGNQVWVNLSTGSKMEAIAAAVACMGNGGIPYYVRMKSYRIPTLNTPSARGVDTVDPVPPFGLSVPSTAGLSVLDLLSQNERGLSKRVLIQGLTELGVIPKDIPGKTVQARYARLQTVLEQLTVLPPLIEVDGSHRRTSVRITDRGRLALRIFAPRPGLAESFSTRA